MNTIDGLTIEQVKIAIKVFSDRSELFARKRDRARSDHMKAKWQKKYANSAGFLVDNQERLARFEAVEHSVQRIWGTVAQNEDLPNEKMCAMCGHSESRHQTAGGFCKHCTCNEFVESATSPNR